jgi:hypothetical protein
MGSVKGPSPRRTGMGEKHRVEMWRGGCRSNISVTAPFVWRFLTGLAVAPCPSHRRFNAVLFGGHAGACQAAIEPFAGDYEYHRARFQQAGVARRIGHDRRVWGTVISRSLPFRVTLIERPSGAVTTCATIALVIRLPDLRSQGNSRTATDLEGLTATVGSPDRGDADFVAGLDVIELLCNDPRHREVRRQGHRHWTAITRFDRQRVTVKRHDRAAYKGRRRRGRGLGEGHDCQPGEQHKSR